MPISVIVGGQFGSEGKGKVAHHVAASRGASLAVRVGGPNSGHTVVHEDRTIRLRVLPTPSVLPEGEIVLPPGNYVSLPQLQAEIEAVSLDTNRLHIDPKCMVLEDRYAEEERASPVMEGISSTKSGTGLAVAARVRRDNVQLASDVPELKELLTDTLQLQRSYLDRGARIVVEGTQGYGLSVLHAPDYPFATSRDTTAAGFLSECGLSPLDVDEVVLVLRAFPIRVAGTSGPLPREVDWDHITETAGGARIEEYTTVTRRLRRVAMFDPYIVNRAIYANQPTSLILNHVDYFDDKCRVEGVLTSKARRRFNEIATSVEAPIDLVGVSPETLIPV